MNKTMSHDQAKKDQYFHTDFYSFIFIVRFSSLNTFRFLVNIPMATALELSAHVLRRHT